MPSVFTHAVAGAAMSTLAPHRFRGLRLGIVLSIVAALPDVDVFAFGSGSPTHMCSGIVAFLIHCPSRFSSRSSCGVGSLAARPSCHDRVGGCSSSFFSRARLTASSMRSPVLGWASGSSSRSGMSGISSLGRPILTSPLWLPVGLMVAQTALARRTAERGMSPSRCSRRGPRGLGTCPMARAARLGPP